MSYSFKLKQWMERRRERGMNTEESNPSVYSLPLGLRVCFTHITPSLCHWLLSSPTHTHTHTHTRSRWLRAQTPELTFSSGGRERDRWDPHTTLRAALITTETSRRDSGMQKRTAKWRKDVTKWAGWDWETWASQKLPEDDNKISF